MRILITILSGVLGAALAGHLGYGVADLNWWFVCSPFWVAGSAIVIK